MTRSTEMWQTDVSEPKPTIIGTESVLIGGDILLSVGGHSITGKQNDHVAIQEYLAYS